jgi:ABC-type branched-subunit amino acid transport system permease subunit
MSAATDDLEAHDERLKDRLLNSEFALRNTLGTIGGLFISVASLLAALSPRIPRMYFVAIILLCSTVLVCVLLDFRFYRRGYQGIAFTPKHALRESAAVDAYCAELERQKQQTNAQRRWKNKREKLCYFCLATTVILFIIVVTRY